MRAGRGEERLRGARAPVDEQRLARAVRQAHASDVADRPVRRDRAPEAQVDAVPTEQAQPCAEPVDLLVALQRGGPTTTRRSPRRLEPGLQVGDRAREGCRDHGEVPFVGVDVLRAVKRELDPAGILNPGILIP